jgi:hypothetical protein
MVVKRLVWITLLVIVLAPVAGCSVVDNAKGITEYIPNGGQGERGPTVSIVTAPEVAAIGDNTEIPSSFPIYVNKYAFSQEGPLFEIDDALTDIMTKNLRRYLGLLYGESAGEQAEIVKHPEVPYKVLHDSGKSEMWSGVSDISIITNESNIVQDLVDGKLEGNELVGAALQYLGIEKPQVASTIEYDADGNVYEYQCTITESTDDVFQNILNTSFNYVRVTHNPKSENAVLVICGIGTPEKHGDYQIVSYSRALRYLQDKYPNLDTGKARAEIYYSGAIQPGYYIPCYRFYLGEASAEDGTMRYQVVHLLMVEK